MGSRVKGRSSHVWVECPVCGKEVQRAEFAVDKGLFESCAVCRPPVAEHCPESVWNPDTGRWTFCQRPWSHDGRCAPWDGVGNGTPTEVVPVDPGAPGAALHQPEEVAS